MTGKISRRSFIKKGAFFGALSLFGGSMIDFFSASSFGRLFAGKAPDISVVKGSDYFNNTIKAVEMLGGMKRFVSKNAKVAILPNSQRNNPGVFTNPEIVRAVIRMCKQAGAAEVNCLTWLPEKIWADTGLAEAVAKEGGKLVMADMKDESQFKPVPIPRGTALKEARIMNELFNNDVFITIPISKDHAGNKFTATLKNMMGLNSPQSNRTFHQKDWSTNPDSIAFLDQCIADLNTVVTPDLCIVDSTQFITTNGPFGPGKLAQPQEIVAGTDRVAIDSYCCGLLGLKPQDIIMIGKARELGLGQMDLSKLKIKKVTA